MDSPKFEKGQKVKFINDHDRMTGEVLSFSWDSETGYTYTISSKHYDAEINDMREGIKICKEAELVDMTDYKGPTTPVVPDIVMNVADKVTAPADAETSNEQIK